MEWAAKKVVRRVKVASLMWLRREDMGSLMLDVGGLIFDINEVVFESLFFFSV